MAAPSGRTEAARSKEADDVVGTGAGRRGPRGLRPRPRANSIRGFSIHSTTPSHGIAVSLSESGIIASHGATTRPLAILSCG